MANNLIFKLESQSAIKFKGEKCIRGEETIVLAACTDSIKAEIYLHYNGVDEIDKREILELISPQYVYDLLESNLSGYEYEEIESILDYRGCYYFEDTRITTLNKKDIEDLRKSFKDDVEASAEKYPDNVDIVFDYDQRQYDIMYADRHNSFSCAKSYGMKYIDEDFVHEVAESCGCGVVE